MIGYTRRFETGIARRNPGDAPFINRTSRFALHAVVSHHLSASPYGLLLYLCVLPLFLAQLLLLTSLLFLIHPVTLSAPIDANQEPIEPLDHPIPHSLIPLST